MSAMAPDPDPAVAGAGPLPDWSKLFDASPIATLIFTPDLVMLDGNAAHARTTGVPVARLRGRYMFDVFPKNPDATGPDTEAVIRASVARVIETRRPDEPPIQKHDLPRPEGGFEPRYWRIVHSPVVEDEAVVAIRQDSWDVTATMLETARQDTLQRAAGRLAGIAFWELDPAADRIVKTREFDLLFGFPPDAGMSGDRPFSTYAECFHPDDRAMIRTAISDLLEGPPGETREFEYRIVRPDGALRRALVRGEATAGRGGRRLLTGITFDVTDLRATEARLARLVEDKEALLGEVNHRVKNSLQLVSALLSMEARQAGPGEDARLRSAAARVQSVAAIHGALYQGAEIDRVEMATHLRSFCAHLADSLGASERGVALEVEAEDITVSANRAIPLSLIVNELVTNAFKHAAFGADGAARVSVRLERDAGDRVVLTVSDTGGDGPAPEAMEGPSGLGSKLIDALARQVGGTLEQSREGGWTTRLAFEDAGR